MASDFSVFHRVDYPELLPAQVFIDRAIRLGAYAGALAARLTREEQQGGVTPSAPAPGAPAGARRDGSQNRTVNSTAAALATDPGLGGMIEVSKG